MSAMVIFGLIASVALLFAFFMLNSGKWTADTPAYQALNFVGAGFLAASAYSPFNAGVFWTELIWSLIGLYGLIKIYVKRAKQPAN
ncbi:transporter [Corynebacterium imitans]|uniref:CBU_0592 family membrane protein n=1 Tax=Corynebacterium imitans TaxID=156978 RepID=UPI001EF23B37|nr:transporter [Corynebacterium imitans]MCG7278741.1 transporter [Corynebacterium imitans]MDK8306241.1 transporter [Corynebacterium imitans]MDK8637714.1 transporter [Corynebacterium imitans]MDK8772766.1 transporter [Corynebacterium imitans]